MLRRWATYVRLGLLDLVRLWPTTQHHVIIVAGICLPILLLLGLKRGHVAQLREALLKSPTGRQVVFGSGRSGELLTRDSMRLLEQELPGVEVIIPDVYRLVNLQAKGKDGITRAVPQVTCYATGEVDPYLAHLGATLPVANAPAVILGKAVADALQAQVGDPVQVTVRRQVGVNEESVTVTLSVLSVIETDNPGAQIAYVDQGVHDRFSLYGQGAGVPEYGWAAGGASAPPRYRSYLAFCERGKEFSARDRRDLEDNYTVEEITGKLPEALARLMAPDRVKELRVYELRSRRGKRDLEEPHKDIYDPEATDADEVVLPWNEPLTGEVGGQKWTLVGLSLDRRRLRWLRNYFRDEAYLTDITDDPLRLRVIEAPGPIKDRSINWPLTAGSLRLAVLPGDAKTAPATLAVVPAGLLAWLHAEKAGDVVFDPGSRLFKLPPAPPRYNRARLYAHTIDDVPAVVDALWERHFSISAEQARIREIHKQDASLQLLVLVVGAGVFVFGVITVVSVLLDSTDRKRGTIGILRVMGTSQSGVFLLIFIRAVVIGLLSTLLCAGMGWLLAVGLSWQPSDGWAWKPVVAVELLPGDFLLVGAGAVVCCAAGALWPAWRASRLDPFEAIVEGRFR